MRTQPSTTPLLDRIHRGGPRPPHTSPFVAVSCPPGRHPQGCPHTPDERREMSPFLRRALAGDLPAVALTTEVGR